MDRLWSPWRSEYVTSAGKDDGCIFCSALEEDDEQSVLWRGERSFVLLNAFPYNSGHVMVAPVRHVGALGDLEGVEAHDLMDATRRAVAAIDEAMSPDGFNVGSNLGSAAGAGVPGHLHVHVVPRWAGDTNFMPVVGATKVLPEMLSQTREKLKPFFS